MTEGAVPRVSVLLPVRTPEPYLAEALDSLRRQTFHDFEVLVIDDGRAASLTGLAHAHDGPRVRVLRPAGRGIAAALNHGVRHARGDLIARQDADDRSRPDRLSRQVSFLDGHPEVSVVASRAEYLDAAGARADTPWTRAVRAQHDPATSHEALGRLLPLTCCLAHGSVVLRRTALEAVGGYREAMVPAEDYDLWLRLLPRHRFAKLPEALYGYRVHAGQESARRRREQAEQCIRAKIEYLRGRCPWLPSVPRFVLPCVDRGAEAYRSIAPEFDCAEMPCPSDLRPGTDLTWRPGAPGSDSWDLVILTDFPLIDDYRTHLARVLGDELVAVGNFLLWRRRAGR